jgi:hypothetical protein
LFLFRQLKHKEEAKHHATRDSDLRPSSAKFHHNTTGDEDDEYQDEERGTELVDRTSTLNRMQTMEVDLNAPPPPVITMPGNNKQRRKSSMFDYFFGEDTPTDSNQGTEASTPAVRYKVQGKRILDVDLDVIPDGKLCLVIFLHFLKAVILFLSVFGIYRCPGFKLY